MERPDQDDTEGDKEDEFEFEVQEQPMSKRQKKRLLNDQKYRERRKIWKLKKKEKKAEQRRKRKEELIEGRLATDLAASASVGPWIFPKKFKSMDSEDAFPLRVAIDMSLEEYMTDKDIRKLLKQIQRTYAANRRSENPVQLYLTSFGGRSKEQLELNNCQYGNWDVHIKKDSYCDVFSKDDVVYLTSESPNVLEDLDMTKAYIIGGLVDHNHRKGLCHRLAVERGVAHAQLPISDFVKLNSRKVLTVNHVFEILLRFAKTQDWKDAFDEILPARKVLLEDQEVAEENKDGAKNAGNTEDESRKEGGENTKGESVEEGGQEIKYEYEIEDTGWLKSNSVQPTT